MAVPNIPASLSPFPIHRTLPCAAPFGGSMAKKKKDVDWQPSRAVETASVSVSDANTRQVQTNVKRSISLFDEVPVFLP